MSQVSGGTSLAARLTQFGDERPTEINLTMYASDIEIVPGHGWANVQLGSTLDEVRAALANHGHAYDLDEEGYTLDIYAPEVTFYFDDSSPKQLLQIVFYDKDHQVDGQPVIGLTLAEALLPFDVQGYDDTLWSLVSIEEEYQKGKPLDDSKRLRRSNDKQNLDCATLWILSQAVGLVMLDNHVHAIAIRRKGEAPRVGCGRLDSQSMVLALNAKPTEEPTRLPRLRLQPPQPRLLGRLRKRILQFLFVALAVVFTAIPIRIAYRDLTEWGEAVAVVGSVIDAQPEGPFPDEVTVRYTVPDSGEHQVTIPTTYTTVREIGEEVELEYLPDQPHRAMTRVQIRDAGFSIPLYYLFGSIGLAGFFLYLAFPNYLRLAPRGNRVT